MFNHLDLFSGIGGFALAAKWAQFNTIAFCEKDKFCQKVLKKHWPLIPCYEDIKTLPILENIDLLTAGLPCQPFSIAGKRKGKEDERYLWESLYRIIRTSKPKFIIIENVKGIIPFLEPIISDLEKENYFSEIFLLPASATKAPHRRERIWIIAYHNSQRCQDGRYNGQTRFIQINQEQYLAQIQQEWKKLIPESWSTMSANEFMQANIQFMRNDDGISSQLDKSRIKSLGNAIVPQAVFPIMKWVYNELGDT